MPERSRIPGLYMGEVGRHETNYDIHYRLFLGADERTALAACCFQQVAHKIACHPPPDTHAEAVASGCHCRATVAAPGNDPARP